MSSRRDFILSTAAVGATLSSMRMAATLAATAQAVAKPIRILMLGGTGFIGRHFVNAALARGHQVAVFSRGKMNTDFPASVEQLVGDRNSDLKSIENRDWDAVFDLVAYVPNWVRTVGKALQGRVKHYTFVSSVMAYQYPGATDEKSKVKVYTDSADPYSLTEEPRGVQAYGSLKVLCEKEAEAQFPGKVVVLRPDVIAGPGGPANFFTYWAARMEKGGEIIAAGDPKTPVQYIDVRDLAEWGIRLSEAGKTGTFNAVGPAKPMGWGEMLNGIRAAFSVPTTLTWVPTDWLMKQGLIPVNPLLIWATQVGTAGSNELNNKKALANGLTFRSLRTTVVDSLNWYKSLPKERRQTALPGVDENNKALEQSMAREAELLADWHRAKF
jgi:2'-hydroxyisoflavone reductase